MTWQPPRPYPNEFLLSIFARWCDRLRARSSPRLERVLGSISRSRGGDSDQDSSNRAVYLSSYYQLSSVEIIEHHALSPFFAWFDNLGKMLLGSHNGYDKYLRYCPLCVQEDEQLFGEPYWHREHQFPSLTVCVKHHVMLENGNVVAWGERLQSLWRLVTFRNVSVTVPREVDKFNNDHRRQLLMADIAMRLLTTTPSDESQFELTSQYLAGAAEREFQHLKDWGAYLRKRTYACWPTWYPKIHATCLYPGGWDSDESSKFVYNCTGLFEVTRGIHPWGDYRSAWGLRSVRCRPWNVKPCWGPESFEEEHQWIHTVNIRARGADNNLALLQYLARQVGVSIERVEYQ